jgi:hypothetical protein
MPFLIILAILAIAGLAYLKTPTGRGWLGEFRVKLTIGKTNPGISYVINDCRIRVSEDKTTQIDHIVINENGVFVIETKNYSGRIYGQENQHEWIQVLSYGKVKNKLYNPVKQNKTHVYNVSKVVGLDVPVVSAVVFVQGNVQYISADGVYTLSGLKRLLKNGCGYKLNTTQMEAVYTRITQANDETITKSEHIHNIHNLQSNVANNICPRCGKKLVIRHGKNGNFMGCTGYPQCKFTKNI